MFLLKHYVRRHGLRTPNDAFFFKIPNFCAWADKFWGIWGIFKQFISTHFGTVSPLSMFSINLPFYKKLNLYIQIPNNNVLIGSQRKRDLAIVCL